MVQSKALRKFLVPFGIFLVLVTVAIVKKMRTVAAGEEAKVVLCHIPAGNPENAHTIEVGESAVDAHLEHGDLLGECEDEDDDGNGNGGEDKVTLCHIPPGNPENAHTIEVGESAVDAHLDHGDLLGECEGDDDDGDGNGGENKVTLCHVPPGNPDNAHTIEVGESAVDAHLEHGDYLGECEGEEGDDNGNGGSEKVEMCHIPPGNPENAHTIEIPESAVEAHLAHGDILGACEGDEGNDNGGGEKVTICHIPPGNPENAHTIEVSESAVAAHLAHGDVLGACEGDEDGDDDNGADKVTICHIPPGNPENAHTIEISESAVAAHLAHGDTLGECPEEGDEGDGDDSDDDDEDGDDDGDDGDDGGDGDDDGGGDDGGDDGDDGDDDDDDGGSGDDDDEDGDEDGDGVDDSDDLCPGTPPNTPVDEFGCEQDDDEEETAAAPDDDSGDGTNSRPDPDDGNSGNQQGPGGDGAGDGDKNGLLIQMQPGATGEFDGNVDGEMNICGYITPVGFTMMFAGLLLMRVGTGRRRF